MALLDDLRRILNKSLPVDPHGSGAYKYFLNTLLRSGNSKQAEFFAQRMVYNYSTDNQGLSGAGQSPVDLVDHVVDDNWLNNDVR